MNIFRKKDSDHNTGTDRYLITYADLITLLLGLFVILYASAQVDSQKFKQYSAAFSNYFKAKDDKVLQGGDGVLEGHQKGVPEAVLAPKNNKSIEQITRETREALSPYIQEGTIQIKEIEQGIVLVFPEKLLFESAKAQIRLGGETVLDTLSNVLSGLPQQIMIDGHTDSDPITTFQYESNWHLSVARATNVAYRLIQKGVPEENLIIRGFGSQRPVAPNDSPDGKSKNRRVEITIKEKSPESASSEGYLNEK